MKRKLKFSLTLAGLALIAIAVAPASQALDRPGTIRITTREVAHRIMDQGRPGRGPVTSRSVARSSTTRA